jgi:hypothetical protein
MTTNEEREYVRRWVETGRALEGIRWQELRARDDDVALCASDELIENALLVPLPPHRGASRQSADTSPFHADRRPHRIDDTFRRG